MRSITSSARTASISSDTVKGSPARRSIWPKASVAVMRSRGAVTSPPSALRGDEALEPARRQLAPEAPDVVRVLQDAAQGLGHQLLVQVVGVERRQRLRPVERLGDAGDLGEADRPERLHEARDLAGEALV